MRCATPHCRGCTTAAGRSPLCGKCRYRQWRDGHPLECAFNNLRKRARKRGHEFTLTFDEYQKFAIETGYADGRGKTSTSLSIDRKDSSKGYSLDNIRVKTLAENSRLRFVPYYRQLEEEAARAATEPF